MHIFVYPGHAKQENLADRYFNSPRILVTLKD